MTDYKKLVEALRCNSLSKKCDSCGYGYHLSPDSECNDACHFEQIIVDAADAIEDLQDTVQAQDKALKECARQLAKMGPKREEVWKDVIGYEGLYQVSDQARVRNNKGKILKQSVKVGKCVYYKYVKLYKDGQYRQGYVHRMMAECFIPNPDNLPIINHKDEDGTNNRLDNLEWCTVEYNSNYGNAKRNMSRGKRRRAKMEVQDAGT